MRMIIICITPHSTVAHVVAVVIQPERTGSCIAVPTTMLPPCCPLALHEVRRRPLGYAGKPIALQLFPYLAERVCTTGHQSPVVIVGAWCALVALDVKERGHSSPKGSLRLPREAEDPASPYFRAWCDYTEYCEENTTACNGKRTIERIFFRGLRWHPAPYFYPCISIQWVPTLPRKIL